MRETYPFNIAKEEHGIFPLSTAQDGAVCATKRRVQMFAEDLSRMLNGKQSKHRWQFVDELQPIAALDAKPKHRLPSTLLPKNKAEQQRNSPVTPFARQLQSQQTKAALVERLYGGGGSLEKKFWP